MATRLRFSRGTTQRIALAFSRSGSAIDLTGASFASFIKKSAFDADADALVDLSAAVVALDAIAGDAQLLIAPADTADLDPFQALYWLVRATLANGDVVELEAHQGGIDFTPIGDVEDNTEDGGSAGILPALLASYVLNRYDLTGLTGGTSVKLDGMSAATLALLTNGSQMELFFTGSISARFRIRAKGADLESAPWRIVCDNAATRLWELVSVMKEGVPCVWNPDTSKFHQLLAAGTGSGVSSAPAPEASAFSLPA